MKRRPRHKKLDSSLPIYFPAISLPPPISSLIANGVIPAINLLWDTPFRGPLIIHSNQHPADDWQDKIPLTELQTVIKKNALSAIASKGSFSPTPDKTPAQLVGYAVLSDIQPPGETPATPWASITAFTFIFSHPTPFPKPYHYRIRVGSNEAKIRPVRANSIPQDMAKSFQNFKSTVNYDEQKYRIPLQ